MSGPAPSDLLDCCYTLASQRSKASLRALSAQTRLAVLSPSCVRAGGGAAPVHALVRPPPPIARPLRARPDARKLLSACWGARPRGVADTG
jgi:hypothetical protein